MIICYSNSLQTNPEEIIFSLMKKTTALCVREVETLFNPFNSRKIKLSSRVVMAPMIRNLAPDGVPTPEMAMYYRLRAERDVGLIITEPSAIDDPAAADDACMPLFYGGAALRGWKRICRAVHATNCKIVPLLCHVGMLRPGVGDLPQSGDLPIGPSGINPITLEKTGEGMSRQRIAEVCASFARAAFLAQQLGFDGVEIQGGQGCLIDQFLWKETNHRRDIYGGDIVGRARFACEVIHAVRKAVGRAFPILFRFSQWKKGHPQAQLVKTPLEMSELLQPLCAAGVDIFDCSENVHGGAAFAGSAFSLAAWIKLLSGKPVISGGAAWETPFRQEREAVHVQRLIRLLRSGEVDLVSVGRGLLADAAWAEKTRHGRESEIIPFTLRSLSRLY